MKFSENPEMGFVSSIKVVNILKDHVCNTPQNINLEPKIGKIIITRIIIARICRKE